MKTRGFPGSASGSRRVVMAMGLAVAIAGSSESFADGPCHGRFPDLMSDVCWHCVFPISIGPATVTMDQEDNGPSPPLICTCPAPPPVFVRYGVGVGYWEPARISEVVRTPYCSPTLAGTVLADVPAPAGTNTKKSGTAKNAFYQVHWFTFPVLSWISAAFTSAMCRNDDSFDLVYMTELDPLWSDDELTFLINPEAVLFESLPAQAACIADSMAAASSFGIDDLFWCSGSQGSVYPIGGTIAHHVGGVDSSMLETHRMLFKLHRELIAQDTSTLGAMCGSQPQPILRKGQYKLNLMYPVAKADTASPLGRQTASWVAGHEYPYEGEDFTQLVWRKRLCCAY